MSAASSLIRAWYRAKSWGLGKVRDGRPVAWVPPVMNLGNLLTVGRWAYQGDLADDERYVLVRPEREQAMSLFPELRRRYFLRPDQIRFTDQRLLPWLTDGYPRDHLSVVPRYVQECLLPGSPLMEIDGDVSDALVVNVRRGEYYSDPVVRKYFGFDVASYVHVAVEQSVASNGTPARIHVVSDDVGWCRNHLEPFLQRISPVSYGAHKNPALDLATLIAAPRLVLANSTFSYWGGFIGDVLAPSREVWVPWLFCRSMDGGDSRGQISPEWNVVSEIPGGWGPP